MLYIFNFIHKHPKNGKTQHKSGKISPIESDNNTGSVGESAKISPIESDNRTGLERESKISTDEKFKRISGKCPHVMAKFSLFS